MNYITIIKGDDTNFLDDQFIVVNFRTDFSMSGFTATFTLGDVTLTYGDLSEKKIEIVLSNVITSNFEIGKQYGELKLIDTSNRVRTVTSIIPFLVKNGVNEQITFINNAINVSMNVNDTTIDVIIETAGIAKNEAETILAGCNDAKQISVNSANTAETLALQMSNQMIAVNTRMEELTDMVDIAISTCEQNLEDISDAETTALTNITNATANLDDTLTDGLADISTAETTALVNIANATANLDDTVTDGLTDIESARISALNNINTSKTTALSNITDSKINALNNITSAEINSLSLIANAKSNAESSISTGLDNIDTVSTNALSSISIARTNAETAISTGLNNITSANSIALSDISSAENSAIVNVQNEGETQIDLATEQATIATNQATIATNKSSETSSIAATALTNIQTAKTTALSDISTVQSTAVADVNTTKITALNDINTAKLQAIEDLGDIADVDFTVFALSADLSSVATSGEYDDLLNKPVIPIVPTNVSSFTNDSGYLTSHQDISNKENISNKSDSYSSNSSTAYASSKALYDGLATKQNILSSTQLNAINSGITANKISTYDGYATSKQDKLTGLSATVTELNYCSGVTSNIQTQINNKASTAVATASNNGLMSSTDKTKLNNLSIPVFIDSVYQNIGSISTSTGTCTISLNDNTSIYLSSPMGAVTYNFDISGLTQSNKAITFELYVDMPSAVQSLTFPATVSWQDGEAPDVSEAGLYLFAFRLLPGEINWTGNLQGVWN